MNARVANPAAAPARLCLDRLTAARARRATYVGPRLPEPVTDSAAFTVESASELAADLSVALLLALERLSPLERAAWPPRASSPARARRASP